MSAKKKEPQKENYRYYKSLVVYKLHERYMMRSLRQQISARDVMGGPVIDPNTGAHFETFLDVLNAATPEAVAALAEYLAAFQDPVADEE